MLFLPLFFFLFFLSLVKRVIITNNSMSFSTNDGNENNSFIYGAFKKDAWVNLCAVSTASHIHMSVFMFFVPKPRYTSWFSAQMYRLNLNSTPYVVWKKTTTAINTCILWCFVLVFENKRNMKRSYVAEGIDGISRCCVCVCFFYAQKGVKPNFWEEQLFNIFHWILWNANINCASTTHRKLFALMEMFSLVSRRKQLTM